MHVLTCTLGEEGEVIPPSCAHLDAAHDDALGPHRREELRAAMGSWASPTRCSGRTPRAGRLSRYRDSGMAGTPSAANPDAFVNADVDEAAALVADVVRRVRPAAVVTYDEQGGYGHPDHIQTHRVTCAAVVSLPESERPPLYAVLMPESWAREDRAWLAEHPPVGTGWALPDPDGDYPPSVVADDLVTHEVVDPGAGARAGRGPAPTRHAGHRGGDRRCLRTVQRHRRPDPGREGFALLDPTTGRLAPSGRAGERTRHTELLGGGRDEPAGRSGGTPTTCPGAGDRWTPTSSGWPWDGSPPGSPS